MMRKSSLHFTRDATVLLFPVILVIFVLVYNISAIFKIHQQAEHDLNIIEQENEAQSEPPPSHLARHVGS